MSTTTQSPPVAIRTGVRRYAILAALLLAILVGAVTALSLTQSDNATIGARETVVDRTQRGTSGCAHQTAVAGGVLEGTHLTHGCDAPRQPARHGGIQP